MRLSLVALIVGQAVAKLLAFGLTDALRFLQKIIAESGKNFTAVIATNLGGLGVTIALQVP
jgi:hypothetical protein